MSRRDSRSSGGTGLAGWGTVDWRSSVGVAVMSFDTTVYTVPAPMEAADTMVPSPVRKRDRDWR